MHDFDQFDRRLAAALRSDADQSLRPFEAGPIARAAIAGTRSAGRFGRGRGMTLLAAAALLLVGGALAAGSGILRRPSLVPPVPAPSFGVVTMASPDATSPSPSDLPSPPSSPSPTTAALTWTQASLNEDWPAPVRTEPAGQPIVVPILLKTVVKGTNCPGDCSYSTTGGHLGDPPGDITSDVLPWADIRDVGFCGAACLKVVFVSDQPSGMDPRQQWIAYGVVVDTDGDGVPDWRYGIDNEPVDTPGADRSSPSPHRWWRTDLHTGRTESAVGEHVVLPSGQWFHGNHGSQSGSDGIKFGGDTTGGLVLGLPTRFYVWASVIQDGRVVATDYAPDAGWLHPSPDAKP